MKDGDLQYQINPHNRNETRACISEEGHVSLIILWVNSGYLYILTFLPFIAKILKKLCFLFFFQTHSAHFLNSPTEIELSPLSGYPNATLVTHSSAHF